VARLRVMIAETTEGVQDRCGVGGQYIVSDFYLDSLKHPLYTTLELKHNVTQYFSVLLEANKIHCFSALF